MAITQADIDVLERALLSGELTVEFANKGRVTYRSVGEIKEALAYARDQLDTASAAGAVTTSVAGFTRD